MPRTYYTHGENASKKDKTKDYILNKFGDLSESMHKYYKDHADEVKLFAPIIATITAAGLEYISSSKKHKSDKRKDETIYDRSEGHYWYLKRKPTNRQWLEISIRHDRGEPYRQILADMNLLKR